MPFRKTYRRKRRPMRRPRKTFRKRSVMTRKLRQTNNQINIKQTATDSQSITAPNLVSTATSSQMQFALNRVPRYTQLKQLFDRYKINGINVKFTLNEALNNGSQNNLSLVYRRDYDGHSVTDTSTTATLLASNNTTKITFGPNRNSHSVFLKPRWLTPVYTGAAQPFGFNSGSRGWLDTNSPNILHYGLEWGWYNSTSTLSSTPLNIQITVTYYLSLKGIIATVAPTALLNHIDNNESVEQTAPSGNSTEIAAIEAQITALQQQQADLVDAHDSDDDHPTTGDISHPDAAYY